LAADGYCVHPGKKFKDGLLTLHPSELSSVIRTSRSGCSYVTVSDYKGNPIDQYTCEDFGTVMTRQFNLEDLNGPVPASAYFLGQPLHDSTIIEDHYFYEIAMPEKVKEMEPAWASCYPFAQDGGVSSKPRIQAVWDPPLVLYPTDALGPPPMIPAKVSSQYANPTTGAVPGMVGGNLGPAATGKPRPISSIPVDALNDFDVSSAAQDSAINPVPYSPQALNPGRPKPAAQTAVITLGRSVFTASALPDTSYVVFGSQTLQAGGPALVTAGQTVSYGTDGGLRVGKSSSIFFRTAAQAQLSGNTEDISGDSPNVSNKGTASIGTGPQTRIGSSSFEGLDGSSDDRLMPPSPTTTEPKGTGKKKSSAVNQLDAYSGIRTVANFVFGILIQLLII
jgi:hypothetical protein